MMTEDPLGFREIVFARMAPLAPSSNVRISQGHLISSDGRHLLLIAEPNGSATNTGGGSENRFIDKGVRIRARGKIRAPGDDAKTHRGRRLPCGARQRGDGKKGHAHGLDLCHPRDRPVAACRFSAAFHRDFGALARGFGSHSCQFRVFAIHGQDIDPGYRIRGHDHFLHRRLRDSLFAFS